MGRSPLGESQISNMSHSGSDALITKQLVLPSAIFRCQSEKLPVVTCPLVRVSHETAQEASPEAFTVFDDAKKTVQRMRRSLSHSASPRTPSTTPSGPQTDAVPQPGFMMRFGMSPLGPQKEPGHVWFNSPLNSAIDITPYSKIYGLHPRFFNFDSSGSMQLTPRAELSALQQPSLAPSRAASPQRTAHVVSTQPYSSYTVVPGSLIAQPCTAPSNVSRSSTRLSISPTPVLNTRSSGSLEKVQGSGSPCVRKEVSTTPIHRRGVLPHSHAGIISTAQRTQRRTSLPLSSAGLRSWSSMQSLEAPHQMVRSVAAVTTTIRSAAPAAATAVAGPRPSPPPQATVISRPASMTTVMPCRTTSWSYTGHIVSCGSPVSRSPATARPAMLGGA